MDSYLNNFFSFKPQNDDIDNSIFNCDYNNKIEFDNVCNSYFNYTENVSSMESSAFYCEHKVDDIIIENYDLNLENNNLCIENNNNNYDKFNNNFYDSFQKKRKIENNLQKITTEFDNMREHFSQYSHDEFDQSDFKSTPQEIPEIIDDGRTLDFQSMLIEEIDEKFATFDYQTFFEKMSSENEFSIEKEQDQNNLELKEIVEKIDDVIHEKEAVLKNQDEEAAYFEYQMPEEWYNLSRKSGKFKAHFPDHLINEKKRIIYIFKNTVNDKILIGKTASGLKHRFSTYQAEFSKYLNTIKTKKKKETGRQKFLRDMTSKPGKFVLGILHHLKETEDLDDFEKNFIKYKSRKWKLYNDNAGGGGGSSHQEEIQHIYAVNQSQPITPQKYYPYAKDDEGNIRVQLTPSIKDKMRILREKNVQIVIYAIKNLQTDQRYIGVTNDFRRRAREHGYSSEIQDPTHHKYEESKKGSLVHKAIAANPENFAIGFFEMDLKDNLDANHFKNFKFFTGSAQLEKEMIKIKESHESVNGLNSNKGGGGPISKNIKRKIDFGNLDI